MPLSIVGAGRLVYDSSTLAPVPVPEFFRGCRKGWPVERMRIDWCDADIRSLLNSHEIIARDVDLLDMGAKHTSFRIDRRYLLKLSDQEFRDETERLLRVKSLSHASTFEHAGSFKGESGVFHYLITDYFDGDDLYGASRVLSGEQQRTLGTRIADFLTNLHAIEGGHYDVGHYVPTIANHRGSWLEGHRAYVQSLRAGMASVKLRHLNRITINEAFTFIDTHAGSLECQNGPRLLHNDFHPRNIIVDNGLFSGVIDWECSQYGEPDFDLSHLVHWCIFPPDESVDLQPFLHSLFASLPVLDSVSDLTTRLTIYQLEHEVIQIIWSKGETQDDRCHRIQQWLGNRVGQFMNASQPQDQIPVG